MTKSAHPLRSLLACGLLMAGLSTSALSQSNEEANEHLISSIENRLNQLQWMQQQLQAQLPGTSGGRLMSLQRQLNNISRQQQRLEEQLEELQGEPGWTLVWRDEFDGDSLNLNNWHVQTGDGTEYGIPGWGNNELQWYQAENLLVADGELIISALPENVSGYPYTSGRIRTLNKVDTTFGRIEARIQVPEGRGLWSAFWMLPSQSEYGGWASGGEIDIMEAVNPGAGGDVIHGTLHFGMAWPLNVSAGGHIDATPGDGYHTYAVEWEGEEIRWYMDGVHYATVGADAWWSYFYQDRENGYQNPDGAPFNQDFHLLLNLAVGGNWPGNPDASTSFPAQMRVDYVRVYECSGGNEDGSGCATSVDPGVTPAAPADVFTASYDLYTDQAETLTWAVGNDTLETPLGVTSFWNNNGALSVHETAIGGEHGNVIEVLTSNSGNISIYPTDGSTLDLFGFGNATRPWELHGGELVFDLFIDSVNTDLSSNLVIKIDSGWPALGSKSLAIADLPHDQWTRVSVPVNDLLGNPGEQPLDVASVLNVFVLEPTSAAHLMIDNVKLQCGHPANNGCGISPPSIALDEDIVEVYTDTVGDIWSNGIGGWDTTAGTDYFDGAAGNHVGWSQQDSGEEGHGQIIDVEFRADGANGVFYIQSPAGVNLGEFAQGNLIFDVRVLDYGSNTSGLVMKVDCGFPCTSGDQPIGRPVESVWHTMTIPVSQLVNGGLDLSKVNTGVVVFPTWGDQQGVQFQLDNIRWEK
ncbi:glycoside hydrolase family 16 protein [Pseudomaricurvus alkylphenolicus]|uniref:glycoside hydrolase family 16 protein n=1 Tax=Pseudomaricurvus alkylphenolicus TaxID=1306991 RepID=UPI00142384F2|nr:glycoside hydrolase family 16 protein [Pseudomaricurvus alkylphenolicus]NIB42631.1 glycoside hydrolase family 16 protein [Pseudomaricurvus alkylphenolicus]